MSEEYEIGWNILGYHILSSATSCKACFWEMLLSCILKTVFLVLHSSCWKVAFKLHPKNLKLSCHFHPKIYLDQFISKCCFNIIFFFSERMQTCAIGLSVLNCWRLSGKHRQETLTSPYEKSTACWRWEAPATSTGQSKLSSFSLCFIEACQHACINTDILLFAHKSARRCVKHV